MDGTWEFTNNFCHIFFKRPFCLFFVKFIGLDVQTDGVQHSQGGKVDNRLKLRGLRLCPGSEKGHTAAPRDAIITKKMLYGSEIKDSGLAMNPKFSDNSCQIFPGGTTLSIFLEIQRSLGAFANCLSTPCLVNEMGTSPKIHIETLYFWTY